MGGRIPNLYNEDDIVVSSSANLAPMCNIFYSKLYTSLVPDELKKGCCVELLRHILYKFSLVT
jgi:hypothetical protein